MSKPKALDKWPKDFAPTYGPFRAVVDKIIDADTLSVLVDLGFSCHAYITVRLLDYSSPESTTPEGDAATAFVEDLLPHGSRVRLHSDKGKFSPTFSRWVAGIELENGQWLGEVLFGAGHARRGRFEG